jgi:hypothetical protein
VGVHDDAVDELRTYVEFVASLRRRDKRDGYAYAGVEDFVSSHGRVWAVSPVQKWPKIPVHFKGCFENALRLAKRYPARYRYVEGIASGRVIPVHHAWCVDQDDLVIDPTWSKYSTVGGAYFGVEIPTDVASKIANARCTSVVLNWPDVPLLKKPWVAGASGEVHDVQ